MYNYLETTHTIRASITTYNSKGGNMSLLNNDEIPLGLGMALAQNMDAHACFFLIERIFPPKCDRSFKTGEFKTGNGASRSRADRR